MIKDIVKLYVEYNSLANLEMNEHISQLHQSDWEKDLGGFYKNIRSVCSHLYISDFNWLKRFGVLRSFNYLKAPVFNNNYGWENLPFHTIEEYVNKRKELDSMFIMFAEELPEEDLGKHLKYKNYKGVEENRNLGRLMVHIFNHHAHHRGMISLYLELLGKPNDFSSMMALV